MAKITNNRLPDDGEKRKRAMGPRRRWFASLDPEDARRYCPIHVNYIGHEGVFPCYDCAQEAGD